jgi:hypothetical protein
MKHMSGRLVRGTRNAMIVVAVSVSGLAYTAGGSDAVSAYTPQNCGNQNITTASQSTSLAFTSQFTSGCGMKAGIKCRYSNGTGDTGLRLSGLIRVGQSDSVSCPSGKVGYWWGHQEGVNW